MTYTYYFCFDISKDTFDVAVYEKAEKPVCFSNSKQGFSAFFKDFEAILLKSFVVLEATGGYERALLLKLCKAGIPVHRVQPLKSSNYIRSLKTNCKTDALDAVALARYGFERHDDVAVFTPADKTLQKLQELHMRICDLKAMRMAERQRAKHPGYASMKTSIKAVCGVLDRQIKSLEDNSHVLIEKAHVLKKKYDVLTNVSGVGQKVAITLIACMPELGTMTRRQAASLAGVAPHPKDSGKYTGYRATKGGRKLVRNALFMATLSATRYNPT